MKQLSFWEYNDNQNICISDVALQLKVSSATIQNWIKTGYLESLSDKTITKKSLDVFIEQHIGKSKLVARANKLYKNNEEENFDISQFSKNDIASAYEQSLSESLRNEQGIFYTPERIAEYILNDIKDVENKLFLEPCCGGGNFIVAAIRKGIHPQNIYAYDTDKTAVAITKKRIFDETGFSSPNIICGDFLSIYKNLNLKFDYIFTNPPWGKKICKKEKNKYASELGIGNSTDTCALFFAASLSSLKENGVLGFLLPEAFFNIATFEDIRKKILTKKILRFVDFEKPFKGLLTKAQSITIQNTYDKNNIITCEKKDVTTFRTQDSLSSVPKHIFNFSISQADAETIQYLYKLPYITLKNSAQWALGIVTGNNEKICKLKEEEGTVPVFRGKDITINGFSEPSLFIDKDLKKVIIYHFTVKVL